MRCIACDADIPDGPPRRGVHSGTPLDECPDCARISNAAARGTFVEPSWKMAERQGSGSVADELGIEA